MEKKTTGMMNFAGVGVNFASPDIQAVKSLEDLDKLNLFGHLAVNQAVKDMSERSVLMALGIPSSDIGEQFIAREKAIQEKFDAEANVIKPTVKFNQAPLINVQKSDAEIEHEQKQAAEKQVTVPPNDLEEIELGQKK